MSVTSLQNKTIRPGSLGSYSYYYSDRRPVAAAQTKPKAARRAKHGYNKVVITLLVLGALIVLPLLRPFGSGGTGQTPLNNQPTKQAAASVSALVAPAAQQTNHCAGNNLDKLVLVSVSQRHLWACQGTKAVYDTPVITGMLAQPDTLTPPGTYHIAAKQTATTLTGTDSTGSWSDPVSYWMPFLTNEHGTYGFHDATWRSDSEFGNVDPNSANASHGCVELPLAASQWLYDWARTGTTVTIQT